jgi:hypothetical protein
MKNLEDKAHCRHCKMILNGEPYYTGKQAFHPLTKERAKSNYYGGFVCSERCDYNASLDLEQSMPGHMGQTRLSVGSESLKHCRNNWN